eukprot:355285-Chlamydomonas_euryale.AAC.2
MLSTTLARNAHVEHDRRCDADCDPRDGVPPGVVAPLLRPRLVVPALEPRHANRLLERAGGAAASAARSAPRVAAHLRREGERGSGRVRRGGWKEGPEERCDGWGVMVWWRERISGVCKKRGRRCERD